MAGFGEIALVRGMHFLSESQATVANNLANANTSGFKRREPYVVAAPDRFDAVLGRQLPTPAFREQLAWDAGTMQQTDNRRQLALEGDFLLKVRTAQGREFLSRGGDFAIDPKGRLLTRQGHALLGKDGNEITILPDEKGAIPTDITIARDGQVSDAATGQVYGTLGVHAIKDEAGLQPVAQGLYTATRKDAVEASLAAPVRQGFVETSNVDSMQEMVRMVVIQRSFGASQQALSELSKLKESLANSILR